MYTDDGISILPVSLKYRFVFYMSLYARIQITIPKDTQRKLKEISKHENRKMSNMIAHCIEMYHKQIFDK